MPRFGSVSSHAVRMPNTTREGTPRHPQDLRNHVSLTYGFLLTGNQWKLTGADGDHWIQPAWSLCVNNAEVLKDAALKGRGALQDIAPTLLGVLGEEQPAEMKGHDLRQAR